MSLDVYLQPTTTPPHVAGFYELITYFEDDGQYWFLHPLFLELAEQTDEYIDLYGGAIFGGTVLNDLAETLGTAKELTAAQPEEWQVHIGTQVKPTHVKLYSTVNKHDLLAKLNLLEAAVFRAKTTGQYILFWGD